MVPKDRVTSAEVLGRAGTHRQLMRTIVTKQIRFVGHKEGTTERASFDRANCRKEITWTTSDVSGIAAESHKYSTPGVGQEL